MTASAREPPRSIPIRILFASDAIREPLNGVGRVAVTLLRELVARGHEVIPLDWRDNEVARGIAGRCAVLPPRLGWARTALWHLELLRRLPGRAPEHDVLLDPSGYPDALGRHDRLVFVVHDLHMLQAGYYRPFKTAFCRAFLGRGLRNARLLVCPSAHTRHELLRRYAVDPERCVVVPNGLDPALAADGGGEAAAGDPYLLVVGTIEDRKNVHRVAEAYARCLAEGHRVRLLVVGRRGHGAGLFLRRVAEPDLRGAVQVCGGISDRELQRLYRGATALLFPSLEEGFGLPILEAMQAGTPVLTSNASAMPEVAGDAALLVDPLDTDSIHDGMVRLIADAELRDELRRRGRERARDFDAASQARRLEDELLRVI